MQILGDLVLSQDFSLSCGKGVPPTAQPRMLMSQGKEQSLIVCHTELGTGCRASEGRPYQLGNVCYD